MRIVNRRLTFFVLGHVVNICAGCPSLAGELKYFQPGLYSVRGGDLGVCREEVMEYGDENKETVRIGRNQPFLTRTFQDVPEKSTIPSEGSCFYDASTRVSVQSEMTVIKYLERRRCKGVLISELSQAVQIRRGSIILDVENKDESEVDQNFQFRCVWRYKQQSSQPFLN